MAKQKGIGLPQEWDEIISAIRDLDPKKHAQTDNAIAVDLLTERAIEVLGPDRYREIVNRAKAERLGTAGRGRGMGKAGALYPPRAETNVLSRIPTGDLPPAVDVFRGEIYVRAGDSWA